jgi:hypothetical protein
MLPASALRASALPASALPARAVNLIHEYSRPLTRPDWLQSKPIITTYKLYCEFRRRELVRARRKIIILLDNIEQTDWFWTYNIIQLYGLERFYIKYFKEYGYDATNVENIDGVTHAIKKYKRWHNDWETL